MTSTPGSEPQAALSIEEYLALMPEGMGKLNEKMGIEVTEMTPERVVCTMPVEGNTQPFGLLHGGASVVLAETIGSIGASLNGWPDRAPVGVDINATHHRGARAGSTVTGVGTPAHVGRTSASWEVVITDERGKRVCTSRITCALVPLERVGM